ncbi:HNH endonuclease [Nocardia testacea]|uniref:HNH endonuclease n=1 Tax=Nocardia testacea TaxID=248551 RepID=UPI0033D7A852
MKLLFGKSGMFCAFPACRQRLYAPGTMADGDAVLAEIAHIVAHSDTGPRSDTSMPQKDRDKYPNLVLLCGHHHSLVDGQDNSYSIDMLRKWKNDLESWVEERLTEGMRDIRFAELEIICRSLVSGNSMPSSDLTAVPPEDKMQHNELTEISSYRMMLGLMQASQVGDYLQEMATRLDPGFPQRLRKGFVAEYERLRLEGVRGDSLFFAMHNFAYEAACAPDDNANNRFNLQAAALAVLCHLFEVCDVFEVPADVIT